MSNSPSWATSLLCSGPSWLISLPILSQVGPHYFILKKTILDHQAKLHSNMNVKHIPDVILKWLTPFQGDLFSNTGSGVGLPACQSQPCLYQPFVTTPKALCLCFLFCEIWRNRESPNTVIAEGDWSVYHLQWQRLCLKHRVRDPRSSGKTIPSYGCLRVNPTLYMNIHTVYTYQCLCRNVCISIVLNYL